MPSDTTVLHDGPIYKFARRRYSLREPESWKRMREAFEEMTNHDLLLQAIESDLRWLIEQEGTLREETIEQRRARLQAAWDGEEGGWIDREIPGSSLFARFAEKPSYRAARAVDLLHAVYEMRRYISKHGEAGYAFIQGYGLGLEVEQLRVMEFEPDVETGRRVKRGASRGGTARKGAKAERDAEIVRQFVELRRSEPDRSDSWRCDRIGAGCRLKRETVRGIVNRAIPKSGQETS